MSSSKQKMKSNKNYKKSNNYDDESKDKSHELKETFQLLLANLQNNNNNDEINFELEAKFGTKGIKHITRNDYDNTVKKLISLGFKQNNTDNHLLRAFVEYINPKTGITKISNVRVEIEGIDAIQTLCKTNSIEHLNDKIKFIQKSLYKKQNDNKPLNPVEFGEYNFRVTLNEEKTLPLNSPIVKDIKERWGEIKKTFRYLNRTKFYNTTQSLPFVIDLSIVKRSKRKIIKEKNHGNERIREISIPEYNLIDSNVFEDTPIYEIEIEALNNDIKNMEIKDILIKFNKTIKFVLSGLQRTNFPVSYHEINDTAQNYMQLIKKNDYNQGMRIYNKDFIGYSSYTLQIENLINNIETNIPNIRNDYTVTDKADGDRKLLFINEKNLIYLIDTNMNFQFTGAITQNNNLKNTLIDGEHIIHDKNKKFINLYAAFDIYYLNNSDVRMLRFISNKNENNQQNFRLPLLNNTIKHLELKSIINNETNPPIKIICKTFYSSTERQTIFQCCKMILQKETDGLFEYNTDGIIFTPMNYGVTSDSNDTMPKNFKTTWEYSFKWKPPKYNTIDFLVSTKKGPNNEDIINSKFQSGINVINKEQLIQYKTLILRVGFDSKKHGYINPCEDIYNDTFTLTENIDDEEPYQPVRFYPTNPYDPDASICNIILKEDTNGIKQMFTLNGEIIEDNTIVEFSYNKEKDKFWRWEPLRMRYDKTAELRAGFKNFGNAYHVANSNWQSINKPITIEMITTGLDIPAEFSDDDIYYNKNSISTISKTKGLRDFHNLFVKKLLITKISKKGQTLIDYAVGKGGDIPKWIAAGLSFVFGIDISRDNIENKLDGACARFLNFKKKNNTIPACIFINGNSSKNIKNTNAFITDKTKQITNAIFGEGEKNEKKLGKGVYKQYGKGKDGFDVSSMQFALHYMFENHTTLNNFMKNISECTKLNGYFISTFYDGELIFNALKNKNKGETISIYENDTKIWEIKKMYENDTFNSDDETTLGYSIDVFQESINKVFREYLVNFNYLNNILESYGFVLLSTQECNALGLKNSTGLFDELFNTLTEEIQQDNRKKNDYGEAINMTNNEKKISFLNRYVVYKKNRNIDTENVFMNYLRISKGDNELIEQEEKKVEKIIENIEKKKNISKKLKTKLKLVIEKPTPLTSEKEIIGSEENISKMFSEMQIKDVKKTPDIQIINIEENIKKAEQTIPQPIKKRGRPKKIINIQEETTIPLQIENIENIESKKERKK